MRGGGGEGGVISKQDSVRLMCAEDVAFVVGDEGGYVTMVLDWKQKGWGFGLEKPLVACLSMIISLDESLVKE